MTIYKSHLLRKLVVYAELHKYTHKNYTRCSEDFINMSVSLRNNYTTLYNKQE
jgi:hypothetical protein